MKKFIFTIATVLGIVILQFATPPTAVADTIHSMQYSLNLFQTTLMVEQAQADMTGITVHKSTWGALKSLYLLPATTNEATLDSTTTMRAGKPGVGTMNATDWSAFPWSHGDWTSRVLWEAQYALSNTYHNGTSKVQAGDTWFGDWDYVGSDPYARDQAKREAKQQWGYHIGPYAGHYSGGTCTWFVRLILYRSTYWAGYGNHLTTPGFSASPYSWTDAGHMTRIWDQVRPGWVGSSPGAHMLIFESRGTLRGSRGWWVIDSNWVGPSATELIGKHFMTDSYLTNSSYWGWYPSWATTN